MKLRNFLWLGIGAVAILASGCGDSNYGGEVRMTPAESAQQIEDQIKKIEANDKMPPQAKEMAIAALRRSAEMGKGNTKGPVGTK